MALYRQKWFCFATVLGIVLFSGLLWFRFYKPPLSVHPGRDLPHETVPDVVPRETWKAIFIKDEKSGYAVSRVNPTNTGYTVEDTAAVRFNAMGMIQNIDMATRSELNMDFSLDAFDFSIRSGLFDFKASGAVDGSVLRVSTTGAGFDEHQYDIRINTRPYTAAGILLDLWANRPETGTRLSYSLFDPAALQFVPALVHVRGLETVQVFGVPVQARAVDLSVNNLTQTLWMNLEGRVVLETGMLGMRLEAGTREQAMAGITRTPRHDLTRLAAVIPDKPIENQTALTELVIGLSGIDLSAHDFDTHRQTLDGSRLTITKESLSPDTVPQSPQSPQAQARQVRQARPDPARFLSPGPFIQSDHPRIIELARSIVQDASDDLQKVGNLVTWVFEQIDKQPTPSIPDALSTLAVRRGDCNEHAVLLAALGRAAGIPTRIETGLTYLDGRFMYHAWNAFFIGHWVTGDAVFNQVPADVTHVGILTSENGTGAALAGMIGNLQITIVEAIRP
jgi:hypothetical protein